ncbi:MAG: class I SAM-dependent methyltransferase [Nanoarchaeota archaeon]|nr:class I SAM-dependent methyltransferase [Nanoarchaeota archaeon]
MEINKKEIQDIIKRTNALLTEKEAERLFSLTKNLSKNGVIVEIGSYKGGSAIILAKGAKKHNKNKVYAIDPHNNPLGSHDKTSPDIIPKNTLPFFIENIKKEGLEGEVVPIVKTSEEAAKNWKKPISLLWIDGNHLYEFVKMDFILWEKYLVKGGIIAFHDSWEGGGFNGPVKVIEENISNSKRFSDIKIIDRITFAKKIRVADFSERQKNKLNLLSIKIRIPYQRIFIWINKNLGLLGIFLKKNHPKMYITLKKIKKMISKLKQK